MTALYTWRDVERRLRTINPPPWIDFSVDLETLAISCHPGATAAVKECLSILFGPRFTASTGILSLESAQDRPRRLAVLFDENDQGRNGHRVHIVRPLWPDADQDPGPLKPLPESPKLVAFYSYKGGVGRSTTLLATLGALLEQRDPGATVLVVDADLEAPGLTLELPGSPDRFSLLDFLALVHDAEDWHSEVLPLAAERLAVNRELVELPSGRASFYFLPAYRGGGQENDQLFAPPVTMEQLVRARHRAHVVADALVALGAKIGAQAVLVDLRAGVNELSSPLMLDPRVQNILVTSCSHQSLEGTMHVLHRLEHRASRETRPVVVLSLIPPGFSEKEIAARVGKLAEAIPQAAEDPAAEMAETTVLTAEFAQELLHYSSVEELLAARLPGTALGKHVGRTLAPLLLPKPTQLAASLNSSIAIASQLHGMQAVAAEARKLEYAEGNAELGLLVTVALAALAEQFPLSLPAAVVLGAKGAGKTFAWGQMVLAGDWAKFAHLCLEKMPLLAVSAPPPSALVFPLLHPASLRQALADQVHAAEQEAWQRLGHSPFGSQKPLSSSELAAELGRPETMPGDELRFWTERIARRLGLGPQSGESVSHLAEALAQHQVSICLAIDGLEEAFNPSPTAPLSLEKQRLLRGLLQRLTLAVRDLRSPHLGVVTFVRHDLAESAISQNFGQFEALHQKFVLSWTPTEALRLVAWLLERAGWYPIASDHISIASQDELSRALESFWGKKLGPDHSKEAFTDRWVIAALSDFHGRLQARDLVRLMRYAAEIVPNEPQLTPRSLRDALIKCSLAKIGELESEIPGLQPLFERLRKAPEEKKRIPFVGDTFDLNREEVQFLERQGIVFQHLNELYLPEIVRHGLGFKLESGRRAKVIALYRAAQARRL
jgi:MinD-like ATPase involved in chromosome partitioning or flagellar assembly